MKTRIIQPTEQEPKTPIKYPCLMKHDDGAIVYATTPTDGVVLLADETSTVSVGESFRGGRTWVDIGFPPMRGKVVIEFDMEDGQ